MAFVTLQTYAGDKVNLNPDHVQAVTAHNSFDENLAVPEELTFINSNGDREVRPDKRAEANAFRTAEHTLVLMNSGASFEVKGTVTEVLASLKGK